MTQLRLRARLERGASAVEYAMLIAGIAAVLVTAIIVLGGDVQVLLRDTCDRIGEQSQSGSC